MKLGTKAEIEMTYLIHQCLSNWIILNDQARNEQQKGPLTRRRERERERERERAGSDVGPLGCCPDWGIAPG